MRERFYSTAELARICGVSISTIKRWTDSGLLRCVRTPGGHRKFRLQDVAQAARRLETSMIMPEPRPAAHYDELTLLLLQQNHEALAARVAETLSSGDGPGCRRWLVDLHRHGMGAQAIAGDVLWAALSRIAAPGANDYKRRRAWGLAEEAARHLAAQLPPPNPGAPKALLAQVPGGGETLWLGFALLVLREATWDVVDLGANVPLELLRAGAAHERPQLIVLAGAARAEADLEPQWRQMTTSGADLWVLSETSESLARLETRLRPDRLTASSQRAPGMESLEGPPRRGDEIFSMARRLS